MSDKVSDEVKKLWQTIFEDHFGWENEHDEKAIHNLIQEAIDAAEQRGAERERKHCEDIIRKYRDLYYGEGCSIALEDIMDDIQSPEGN